jgi:hypothetical protein
VSLRTGFFFFSIVVLLLLRKNRIATGGAPEGKESWGLFPAVEHRNVALGANLLLAVIV